MNGFPKTGQSAPQLFRLARARSAVLEVAKDIFVTRAKHPLRDLILAQMFVHGRSLPYFAPLRVMLSAAKHLQFRLKTNHMQILRFAQNDSSGRDPCHAERSEASRQFVML
jgi:hypothetical protein